MQDRAFWIEPCEELLSYISLDPSLIAFATTISSGSKQHTVQHERADHSVTRQDTWLVRFAKCTFDLQHDISQREDATAQWQCSTAASTRHDDDGSDNKANSHQGLRNAFALSTTCNTLGDIDNGHSTGQSRADTHNTPAKQAVTSA